ncbi:ATPase GET3 [Wallemia ichthyophaga EXF-994]|uniref:ATPase GET3 n=1 Tax=Wallemia ichthyophaga (strain EXF-994 / CBS 113033) TaxID=1299270 RepID=R9AET7_WALI9|nr:ATPase GET3 [Wallemia ichthyophaga EXF-994]EOR00719.1 ATPase GET3 [Wallemia ichthyophaga EXF-994]
MADEFAPTLENVVNNKVRFEFSKDALLNKLRRSNGSSVVSTCIRTVNVYIFELGGKGGVGKTTTSCSLAIQLAKSRESVLLISTDPAHNLSDAFNQKFSKEATNVNGFDNLSAMEIDPSAALTEMVQSNEDSDSNGLNSFVQDLAFAIPGVDEAMGFAEIMKYVNSQQYSCIVFDTAPTGHTLRFLSFPTVLSKALEKISSLSGRFGGLINNFTGMMGGGANAQEDIFAKLESMRTTIDEVNTQFKNADLTTFVCVCIAEFLSIYETERLIQELSTYGIDTSNIVINNLLLLPQDDQGNSRSNCDRCLARDGTQKKYLAEADDL